MRKKHEPQSGPEIQTPIQQFLDQLARLMAKYWIRKQRELTEVTADQADLMSKKKKV